MLLFPNLGKNRQHNFNTRTRKLVRLGDWIFLVLQWWWSALDSLHRERRQKPLKRTSFDLNEFMFIVSLKMPLALFAISFFVSLFVTLENAAKFTKLSARTYGGLVSAHLVWYKWFFDNSVFCYGWNLSLVLSWFVKAVTSRRSSYNSKNVPQMERHSSVCLFFNFSVHWVFWKYEKFLSK